MATISGAALGWAPTPDDQARAAALWARLAGSAPALPAAAAAPLLAASGLPREALRDIWTLADAGDRGALDFAGFTLALRLVAMAQAGAEVSAASVRAMARMPLAPPALAG
jgi:hypothetical protein